VGRDRRLLITGGAGFVGSNLAHHAARAGWALRVVDALTEGGGGDRRNLAGLDVDFIEGDIRDAALMARAATDVDAVVHCAARTSHPGSLRAPLEDASVNLLGTLTVLEATRAHSAGARFVQVSTSSQLGPLSHRPANEDHPERPVDLYSAHKAGAEKSALVYAAAHDMQVCSVRLPNLYGPRARMDAPGLSVAAFFIGRAHAGETLTVFRPGDQLRNFLYVGDACAALMAALQAPAVKGQVLQAAHDAHHSLRDYAQAVVATLGGAVEMVDWPAGRRGIELGDVVLDNARAKAALGWAPTTALTEGLRRTAEWLRGGQR
jgi:UDP-glucose 4-epimerase